MAQTHKSIIAAAGAMLITALAAWWCWPGPNRQTPISPDALARLYLVRAQTLDGQLQAVMISAVPCALSDRMALHSQCDAAMREVQALREHHARVCGPLAAASLSLRPLHGAYQRALSASTRYLWEIDHEPDMLASQRGQGAMNDLVAALHSIEREKQVLTGP